MPSDKEKIVNLPNAISFIRILMAPVLFYLAVKQQPEWFLIALIFTVFTDVLDGFLARMLNQITAMGAHLDSWGDFIIYSTMAICAWILWPEILLKEKVYFFIILFSFTAPALIGLIKFRTTTGYHTWAVKLAVAVTIVGYILLFGGYLDWPFRVAALLSLYAALEEIAITLIMRHEHVDVRTLRQAMKYNRESED